VLTRIHKPRAVQFWDHDHLVAQEISREFTSDPAGPKLHCCTLGRNLRDFAALYPKEALWQVAVPKADFTDVPVVHVQPALRSELAALPEPEELESVYRPDVLPSRSVGISGVDSKDAGDGDRPRMSCRRWRRQRVPFWRLKGANSVVALWALCCKQSVRDEPWFCQVGFTPSLGRCAR
jgi:hypothetical protein